MRTNKNVYKNPHNQAGFSKQRAKNVIRYYYILQRSIL